MPIYEYLCQSCGRRSEELQKISDPPLTTCGECGGVLEKQISAPAFHLKGSGWYATDYADKSKSSGKDGGNSGNGESKSGDGKSEKKESDSKSSSDAAKSSSKTDKPAAD